VIAAGYFEYAVKDSLDVRSVLSLREPVPSLRGEVKKDGLRPSTISKAHALLLKSVLLILYARDSRRNSITSQPLTFSLPPEKEPIASSTPFEVVPSKSQAPTPASNAPNNHVHPLDSANVFASKIDAYFSSISSLIHYPSTDESPPVYTSVASSPYEVQIVTPEEDPPSALDFSKSQIDGLLNLYWTTQHPLMPILDEDDVLRRYNSIWAPDGTQRYVSPIIDAITALSTQYACCSGANDRLLGLNLPLLTKDGNYSLIGNLLIQRCRKQIDPFASDEHSILSAIQCYALLSVYLLNAAQGRVAYTILGSAVRLAYSIGLNKEPSTNIPDSQVELRRRIWWFLLHLDFKCSTKLGLPVAVSMTEISCQFPSRNGPEPDDFCRWSYHVYSVKLSDAALRVWETSRTRNATTTLETVQPVESRAKALSNDLWPILDWKQQIQRSDEFFGLELDFIDLENSTKRCSIRRNVDLPPMRSLQRILLQLQYHDALIGLYRQFIVFPTKNFTLQRSPNADNLATNALKHALTVTDIIRCNLAANDILYGWSDVYLWQWNAVLTALGFMLAYPTCHHFRFARASVEDAIRVFELVANKQPAAERAKAIARDLCQRIDSVVEYCRLRPTEHEQSPANASTVPPYSAQGSIGVNYGSEEALRGNDLGALDSSSTDNIGELQNSQNSIEAQATGIDGDDLWAWTNVINPSEWFDYQTEVVEGLLADRSYVGMSAN